MSQPTTRPIRIVVVPILCLAGILLSVIALYQHVAYSHGLATGPSFCHISQHINCEAVNTSAWSVFLGLPIASYGLFFYTALLGLVLLSGFTKVVSVRRAQEVMLFVVTVASILSIFLFCVSEFVIGALCLMCIGLYVVNFLLLAVTWRTGFSGSFFAGLYGGVQNLVKFLIEAFTGSWRALCAFIMLVILAAVSAFSPQVILMLAERPKPPREISDADVFESWKAAEVTDPRVAVTGEAFGDYAEGPESAPIQIVEFADFECPGCRAMYVALREQLQRFNGLYRIVFKNYPLDRECNPNIARDFHRSACFAVMLTRCAGEQGKFWDALHAAFTDPALEQEGDVQEHRDELVEHTVDGLSLDRDAIKECISSGRYKAKILEDIKEGDRLGLFSTPSFWINGKPVIPATLGGMDLIFNAIVAEEGITPNAGQSSEPR